MINWPKVSEIFLDALLSAIVSVVAILVTFFVARRQSRQEFERDKLQTDIDQKENQKAALELHMSELLAGPESRVTSATHDRRREQVEDTEVKIDELNKEIALLKKKQANQ